MNRSKSTRGLAPSVCEQEPAPHAGLTAVRPHIVGGGDDGGAIVGPVRKVTYIRQGNGPVPSALIAMVLARPFCQRARRSPFGAHAG